MKQFKILALFLGFAALALVTSCTKDDLKKPNTSSYKDNYITKSDEDKKGLWIERLRLIQNSELSKNNETIFRENAIILSELEILSINEFKPTQKMMNAAIKLAQVLDENSFKNLYSTFNEFSVNKNGNSCISCINEMSTYVLNYESHETKTENRANKPCNCNWTCGDFPSQCTHNKCEITTTGCGFLWLGSCRDRDEIDAHDCP